MCYRYSLVKEVKEVKERFKVWSSDDEESFFQPKFHTNGFDHDLMPVITQADPDKLQLFNWGPFNQYSAENPGKSNTLNAISEEAFDKISYKSNLETFRCLIPATGFFEWMHVGKDKYPFHISVKDQSIFSFGGLYNIWKDAEGNKNNTFTILTTGANELMKRIHNSKQRMPLIIPPELENTWLKNDLRPEEIKTFFLPYENDHIEAYPIDRKVLFSESHNTYKALTRVDYPELALLMN